MRSVLSLFLLVLVGPVFAQQPGDLDLSFDGDGKVVLLDFDSVGTPVIYKTPDLKTMLAFDQTIDGDKKVRLLRLNEDGSIDNTFGGEDGLLLEIRTLRDMVVTSSGSTILSGENITSADTTIIICKVLNNALPDSSFGLDGIVQLNTWNSFYPYSCFGNLSPAQNHLIRSVKLMPDDKLLLVRCGRIMRLDQQGNVDVAFGLNGEFVASRIRDVALTPSGRIRIVNMWPLINLAAGPTEVGLDAQPPYLNHAVYGAYRPEHNSLTERIIVNELDQSFTWGEDNPVPEPGSGWTVNGYAIGAPAGNGWMGTPMIYRKVDLISGPPQYLHFGPMAMDQQGNFFGTQSISTSIGWKLTRYRWATTMIDFNFGQAGVTTTFLNSPSLSSSITVQEDGKVVVAGRLNWATDPRIVLARYHNIPDPRSKLHLKLFLGGPYDPVTGLMNDHLRQQSLIPFIQPYQPPAFQPKNGVGTWGLGAGVLDLQSDSAVVDWVWLELLDPDSLTHVKATRVGLLHRNGDVTAADGHSPIDFSVGAGSYVLRVRHRNHLSATLADPITLGIDPVEVDLTSPATSTFGTDAQKEVDGVMMLWPGDARGNGDVRYFGPANDRDAILISIGGTTPTATVTGYHREDMNLDGEVKYMGVGNDRDVILQTIGGDVPTAVRVEQGP